MLYFSCMYCMNYFSFKHIFFVDHYEGNILLKLSHSSLQKFDNSRKNSEILGFSPKLYSKALYFATECLHNGNPINNVTYCFFYNKTFKMKVIQNFMEMTHCFDHFSEEEMRLKQSVISIKSWITFS